MKRPDTAQNIALSATVLAAILLMLLLLGVRLDLTRVERPETKETLTMADMEAQEMPQDEFIEPEMEELGEPDNAEDDLDAPMPQGEPDISDTPNDKLVVNGPNPNPNDESEKLVATSKPSPAQTTAPSEKDEPDRRITGMKDKFSPKNGKSGGKGSTADSGHGGEGAGARGDISGGRKLEKYVLPTGFSISKPITVTVTVIVKADGTVEPGSAKCSTRLKDSSLQTKVVKCSEQTRWTPKAGASPVQARLYWTLVPGAR